MIRIILIILIVALLLGIATARDLGQYSQASPEQQRFFRGLQDAGGVPCCDDHDGFDVQKTEARGADLWVLVEGEWFVVPESSRLRKRNPYGSARAWIGNGANGKFVRCYIDGIQG